MTIDEQEYGGVVANVKTLKGEMKTARENIGKLFDADLDMAKDLAAIKAKSLGLGIGGGGGGAAIAYYLIENYG